MDTEKANNTQDAIAVWCLTPNGKKIGQTLQRNIDGVTLYLSASIGDKGSNTACTKVFASLSEQLAISFNRFNAHIFIFSTGIAVRMIANLIESKLTDPAVVVLDDQAKNAVSLLSGHIGGANELTLRVCNILGSHPVITTATDTNNLPAIDMIAKQQDLFIETPENIKRINMMILKQKPIFLDDDPGRVSPHLPEDLIFKKAGDELLIPDIYCSHLIRTVPRETLILRPRNLCVGIGCNRGTSSETLNNFLLETFSRFDLSVNSIFCLATTDKKKDEKGMLEMGTLMNLPFKYFSKQELNSVQSVVNPSKAAKKHLGLNSVSEAAAILSAGSGRLIVEKQKNRDATIAVAVKK